MTDVLAAATRFRLALETTPTGLISFERFPLGACGDASELLGEYFRDCGFGEWRYRMGVNEVRGTHGWIEQDGVLADITADQFPEFGSPLPVIVGTDWSWHDHYFSSGHGSRLAGLSWWDGPARAQVSTAYRKVRATADAHSW